MTSLDWVTIALDFGLLAGLTWWAVRRNRNTADDHFPAGRHLGWVVVGASIVVVNYAMPAPADDQLTGLTYATVIAEQRRESRRSWNRWDVINSAVVLLLIATAYLYFNG